MDDKIKKTRKQLLWGGMAGIGMFFAGLTSAYIVRKAEGNWLFFELPSSFWYSTIAIVVSSLLLTFSVSRLKKNKSISQVIFIVFILGLIFTFFQFRGWQSLVEQGVYFTGEGSNPSGSFLYVLTVAHLVHVLGGLIALLVTLINAKAERYSSSNYLGLELTSIYWHFMGFLWVYLFFFMKYL